MIEKHWYNNSSARYSSLDDFLTRNQTDETRLLIGYTRSGEIYAKITNKDNRTISVIIKNWRYESTPLGDATYEIKTIGGIKLLTFNLPDYIKNLLEFSKSEEKNCYAEMEDVNCNTVVVQGIHMFKGMHLDEDAQQLNFNGAAINDIKNNLDYEATLKKTDISCNRISVRNKTKNGKKMINKLRKFF